MGEHKNSQNRFKSKIGLGIKKYEGEKREEPLSFLRSADARAILGEPGPQRQDVAGEGATWGIRLKVLLIFTQASLVGFSAPFLFQRSASHVAPSTRSQPFFF